MTVEASGSGVCAGCRKPGLSLGDPALWPLHHLLMLLQPVTDLHRDHVDNTLLGNMIECVFLESQSIMFNFFANLLG